MMVYEKITYSRTRSCHYIESFMLFKAIAHNLLRVLFWDRVPELLQLSELIFG